MIDHGTLIEGVLKANRKMMSLSGGSWLSDVAGEGYMVGTLADHLAEAARLAITLEGQMKDVHNKDNAPNQRCDIAVWDSHDHDALVKGCIEVKRQCVTEDSWNQDIQRMHDAICINPKIQQASFVGFHANEKAKFERIEGVLKGIYDSFSQTGSGKSGNGGCPPDCHFLRTESGPYPYLGPEIEWRPDVYAWQYSVTAISFVRKRSVED